MDYIPRASDRLKTIAFYITKDLHRTLKTFVSKRKKSTMSRVIRRSLYLYLKLYSMAKTHEFIAREKKTGACFTMTPEYLGLEFKPNPRIEEKNETEIEL